MREAGVRRHRGRRLVLEFSAVVSVAVIGLAVLTGCGGDAEATSTATTPPASGAEIWISQGCGGCHTLSAADATATVGPNLDETQLTQEQIATIVTDGRNQMPAFSNSLSEEEIAAVAAYVTESAAAAAAP